MCIYIYINKHISLYVHIYIYIYIYIYRLGVGGRRKRSVDCVRIVCSCVGTTVLPILSKTDVCILWCYMQRERERGRDVETTTLWKTSWILHRTFEVTVGLSLRSRIQTASQKPEHFSMHYLARPLSQGGSGSKCHVYVT